MLSRAMTTCRSRRRAAIAQRHFGAIRSRARYFLATTAHHAFHGYRHLPSCLAFGDDCFYSGWAGYVCAAAEKASRKLTTLTFFLSISHTRNLFYLLPHEESICYCRRGSARQYHGIGRQFRTP